jgi:hypothetical protein
VSGCLRWRLPGRLARPELTKYTYELRDLVYRPRDLTHRPPRPVGMVSEPASSASPTLGQV